MVRPKPKYVLACCSRQHKKKQTPQQNCGVYFCAKKCDGLL